MWWSWNRCHTLACIIPLYYSHVWFMLPRSEMTEMNSPPRTVGEFQLSIKQWGKEVKEIKEWELKAYVGSNKMAALQQKWRGFLLLISASHSIKIVWILTGSYFFYFSKIHSINGLQSRPYLFSGRVGLNLHSPGIMNYFCIQAGNVN